MTPLFRVKIRLSGPDLMAYDLIVPVGGRRSGEWGVKAG